MWDFLRGKGTGRQWWLFAVACCHRVWRLMTDERSRTAVEVTARYIEGLASDEEWRAAGRAAGQACTDADPHLYPTREDDRPFWHRVPAECDPESRRRHAAASAAWELCKVAVGGQPSHRIIARVVAWQVAWEAARAVDLDFRRSPEWGQQCLHLRDIFGNPCTPRPTIDPSWPRWNDGTVSRLAQAIYDDRRFDAMPILHDALLDAGCDNPDLLDHCQSPGPHVRGCWVIDQILGKGSEEVADGVDACHDRLLGVYTRQMDQVRAFYQALGFTLVQKRFGGGSAYYTGQVGGTLLEVLRLPGEGPPPDVSLRLGFDVTDLDRVMESLRGLGTPVVMEPQVTRGVYAALVRDPDGRVVVLYGAGGVHR
jgi:hypothetical protein